MVKLSDIINLIGAPQYKEKIFAEPPKLTVPEVSAEGAEYKPIKPKNIYELASQIGVTIEPEIPEIRLDTPQPPSPEKSALQKILDYTAEYPITQTQAKALYELFTARPEIIGYIEKVKKGLFGKKKVKEPIMIAPGPETIKKEFPKIVESPELTASIQRLLGKVAEEAVKKPIVEKGEIKIEELKYPEPAYLAGFRGETLSERAVKAAEEYNENLRALTKSAQDFINSLTSPDLARVLSTSLIAPLSYDVAKDIYNMTGGKIDISEFSSRLSDAVSQSKEYLESSSRVLQDLFDLKIDLISELNKLLGA